MTPTARTRPPVATPSRRPSGAVRATLYDPDVKHGTDACAERTSIGTTACESGFGVAIFPMPDCAHDSDRQLCGIGRCDLSAASRPSAERWTCGPVRQRGTLPIARSNPTPELSRPAAGAHKPHRDREAGSA